MDKHHITQTDVAHFRAILDTRQAHLTERGKLTPAKAHQVGVAGKVLRELMEAQEYATAAPHYKTNDAMADAFGVSEGTVRNRLKVWEAWTTVENFSEWYNDRTDKRMGRGKYAPAPETAPAPAQAQEPTTVPPSTDLVSGEPTGLPVPTTAPAPTTDVRDLVARMAEALAEAGIASELVAEAEDFLAATVQA